MSHLSRISPVFSGVDCHRRVMMKLAVAVMVLGHWSIKWWGGREPVGGGDNNNKTTGGINILIITLTKHCHRITKRRSDLTAGISHSGDVRSEWISAVGFPDSCFFPKILNTGLKTPCKCRHLWYWPVLTVRQISDLACLSSSLPPAGIQPWPPHPQSFSPLGKFTKFPWPSHSSFFQMENFSS